MKFKIFIGADHAGYELKEHIKKLLQKDGYELADMGNSKYDENDDYPDFIVSVAREVAKNPEKNRGIIFGGSGQGEAIAANKVKGARAALYYGYSTKIVMLSRTHNNCNILSIGARFMSKDNAAKAVRLWLNTDFTNEERHRRRIAKISSMEKS